MRRAIFIRVPRIFDRAWGTLKAFLDEESASKMVFPGASPEAERLALEKVGVW